ncbi:YciI family protein [Pseudemcibacter aquimaris]|uniref:YciI family protein n=1 Tax=Pseudemcibacter aquimaris TaxID=2857064 RepID=UPI0020121EDF|nr:YciI family protein [Pseudemcibacter aquimaris]MCC3861874.1 YciI family protein [Pseudemcibacter aquimaris]WDU58627.1 YciI family protein [Pseudemcibacter aquimaris]
MHYIITAFDKENSLEVRMANRADHLAYAQEKGIVVLAGPLLTEGDDPKPRGSMLIVDVNSRAEAEDFAANDPYNKAGLFDKVTIRRWMGALGPWLPSGE